jgi:hypothetical protein
MVVVLGEVFGQLEVGVLRTGHDPSDHPGLLERGQVAVGAALGEARPPAQELRQGQRRRRLGQRLDDAPAVGVVALVPVVEPHLDGPVHIGERRRWAHDGTPGWR